MVTIAFLMFFVSSMLHAQDPQFSQYYAAPLILNPAMTGATDCYRAGFNARTQWVGLPGGGSFNTAAVYADLNYPDIRSGFGIMALHDNIGTHNLSSNEVSGFYSFMAPLSEALTIRFGLQGTYVTRHIDYSRSLFEDQFTGIVPTAPQSTDPVRQHNSVNYPDVSTGMVLFGDQFWLGASAHHLLRPDQGFLESSRLPMRYSLHGGYDMKTNRGLLSSSREMRVIPTFMYKRQVAFDQLDLGVYVIEDNLMAGLWYRGIPIKQDEGIMNRDAVVVQVGYRYDQLSFGYSYDFTISRLHIANTYGSHELSVTYLFCLDWPRRKKPPPRSKRELPCPDFQRSQKYDGAF